MASATPSATPDVAPIKKFESPFNSRNLVITIGMARKPFMIHEAKLMQTSFFDVHGKPPEQASNRSRPSGNHTRAADDDTEIIEVKLEDGSVEIIRPLEADYHLEDRFLLDPQAFNVFVKYLYNEPPTKPSDGKQLRNLSKAYGIAANYECYGLQNRILECIRQYYSRTKVRLDELVWCINRFGDHTKCPLTAYLVEQIAYEVADGGFDDFCRSNILMKPFLEQGNKVVRGNLFAALARHGQNTTAGDPSSGRNRFLVYEKGEHAGTLRE